jgi:hypothetical protein
VSRDDTRKIFLCRVLVVWHSAKKPLCRVPAIGSRQRLTAVSFGTAVDGPLPRAPFAECLTLDKLVFAECRPVPSVQHSVKSLVAESLASPSAALGKAFFAKCPTKGTRQRIQHSAKPWIPVVTGPWGTWVGNASSSMFTPRGRSCPRLHPCGEKLLYPHLLMEEFSARNRVPLPSLIGPVLCFTMFLVARIIIITMG